MQMQNSHLSICARVPKRGLVPTTKLRKHRLSQVRARFFSPSAPIRFDKDSPLVAALKRNTGRKQNQSSRDKRTLRKPSITSIWHWAVSLHHRGGPDSNIPDCGHSLPANVKKPALRRGMLKWKQDHVKPTAGLLARSHNPPEVILANDIPSDDGICRVIHNRTAFLHAKNDCIVRDVCIYILARLQIDLFAISDIERGKPIAPSVIPEDDADSDREPRDAERGIAAGIDCST